MNAQDMMNNWGRKRFAGHYGVDDTTVFRIEMETEPDSYTYESGDHLVVQVYADDRPLTSVSETFSELLQEIIGAAP